MIAYLSGKIIKFYDDNIILDVNNVGYRLFVDCKSINFLKNSYNSCDNIVFWTQTILKNEQQQLCGFLNEEQLQWFQILIQVQGVGSKASLSILSALNTDEIYDAIKNQKSSFLTRAEGVGSKLANRIILELKDKKNLPFSQYIEVNNNNISQSLNISSNQIIQDATDALINLGYHKHEAKSAINHILETIDIGSLNLQELIKKALAHISIKN